ncbi:MAG TPA: hypothetical protein VKE72_00330 [Methylocella sp.]|nr:hypothetical protein [Methylocella sp.]
MPELTHPAPDRNAKAWLRAMRVGSFSVLGFALCWLIVSHSIVTYLAKRAPETALLLYANEPTSLLTLADNEINFRAGDTDKTLGPLRPTPKRLKQLREQVETALVIDPLPSRAYRLLGQIADMEGFAQNAEALMREAAHHSLDEVFAVDWMMRKSFERRNYPAAAFYVDALLRSGAGLYLMPILARMAEDKGAKQEIKKLLAASPGWRPGFFGALNSYITDARTPLDLFLSLKDTQAPPTTEELDAYQAFLFQHKLYELAYYVWLQFLPPEKLEATGFLFNGDFEASPSGSRFDWQVPRGVNVIVDFASRPEDTTNHALVVEFGPGRVEFPGVSQSVMLPPGSYSLKGSLKGEVVGPRGMQWDITCMDGAGLGQSQMMLGSFPDWRAFEFSFVVPETGCPAQLVQLKLAARSPSEQLVSGAIWFDELSISRGQEETSK